MTEAESRLISLSCEIGVLAVGASKYPHFRRSGSSDGGHPTCIPSSRVKVSTAEWGGISDIGGGLFSNSCRRLHVSVEHARTVNFCFLYFRHYPLTSVEERPQNAFHTFSLPLLPRHTSVPLPFSRYGHVIIFVSVDIHVYVIIE